MPDTKCRISFIWSDDIAICIESVSSASPTSKLKKSAVLEPAIKSGNAVPPAKNNLCWWNLPVFGNPFVAEYTCSSQLRVGGCPTIVTLTPPPSWESCAVSLLPAVNS